MKRVLGIGGAFFKSANPEALRAWYAKRLGIVSGNRIELREALPKKAGSPLK